MAASGSLPEHQNHTSGISHKSEYIPIPTTARLQSISYREGHDASEKLSRLDCPPDEEQIPIQCLNAVKMTTSSALPDHRANTTLPSKSGWGTTYTNNRGHVAALLDHYMKAKPLSHVSIHARFLGQCKHQLPLQPEQT
jgi:hypothetical protein